MNMMECLPEAVLEHWAAASGLVHSQVGSMVQMVTHPVMVLQAGEMAQQEVMVMYLLEELLIDVMWQSVVLQDEWFSVYTAL